MRHPEVVTRYTELIGPEKDKLQWGRGWLGHEELSKIPEVSGRRFVSTISKSAGVEKEKEKIGEGLNVVVKAEKWRGALGVWIGEYGEVGQGLTG